MPTRRALLLTILAGLPAASLAQAPPGVAGLWQTIDDRTGQPRATVRLFEAQGRIYGNVERALDPAYAGAICERCTDDRKGKPVEGLQIIRGLARDGQPVGPDHRRRGHVNSRQTAPSATARTTPMIG